MIIKFKRKTIPALGNKRIKRYFVPFYILNDGIVLFQFIYKKQLRVMQDDRYSSGRYKEACEFAAKGLRYDKSVIKKGFWRTEKVYTSKKEAFMEEL